MELELSTPIQEFYKGSVIFITGSTGFLGQVLLEKLLRSCPQISTFYILVRKKKGKDMASRVTEMLDCVIFKELIKQNPDLRHKIVGLPGDCSLENLGLSMEDRQLLVQKVNIVFHCAATIRFDENLKVAAEINLRGTRDIMKMAKEMKKLKAFMHVSTLFANSPNSTIKETFYPPAYEYNQIMDMVNSLPPKLLDIITPELLGDYPNTYTMTKQIAENVVQIFGKGMPVGVFRPSIVMSTYREPVKGWITNFYGPSGYAAGTGIGLIRTGKVNLDCKAHVIPADMAMNFLIASAWDVDKKFRDDGNNYEMEIYNYDCGHEQNITWRNYMNHLEKNSGKAGSIKAIWYFTLTLVTNHYLYLLLEFFLHTIPGALVDLVRICIGKPPFMLKVYKKIRKFIKVIEYFSTRSWNIQIDNYKRVCHSMSPKDKELFFCDLKDLNVDEYWLSYLLGIRQYLFDDPLETLEEGRRLQIKLYWLHQSVKLTVVLLLLTLFWFIWSTIFK